MKLNKAIMYVCSVLSNCLQPYGLQPTRLLCPWNFPGKNPGMLSPFATPGGSFWHRNQTHISWVWTLAGGYFTTSAAWEAKYNKIKEM